MEIQWSLVIFTTLACCGAWLFVMNAIAELRGKDMGKGIWQTTSIIAIVLLVVGGVASATHLSHPDRMLGALSHPTSGIFVEALTIGLLILAIIVYLVMKHREASAGAIKAVAAIAGIIGIFLSFACGDSYIMVARPAWDTLALPLVYLTTGAVSGITLWLVMIVSKKADDADIRFAGRCTWIAAVAALVCAIAFAATSGLLGGAETMWAQTYSFRVLADVTTDTSTAALLFWTCVVAIGCVVPGVIGFIADRKGCKMGMACLVFVAAICGSLVFRVVMWMVGSGTTNMFNVI